MTSPPSSIQSFDTIYPADSLEFCPIIGYQDYFVCGTYYLQKDEPLESSNENSTEQDSSTGSSVTREKKRQTRLGKCWLFRSNIRGEFADIQEIDTPAILDLKWSYSSNYKPRLAIADSIGHLRFYALQNEEPTSASLSEIQTLPCTSEDNICLSLDWSDRLQPNSSGRVVSSISDGTIVIVEAVESSYKVTSRWHAHDFEPWIAAWDYWNTSIVYTGGDDLTWKAWDSRADFTSPLFSNKRSFEGGVTTIQSHPYRENCVAVGSYDENVRIFDTRKPMTPVHTVHVGGGAWRVKWHPSAQRSNDLLVACMHDGFKVIQMSSEDNISLLDSSAPVEQSVVRFDEHGSLAYGVDWCHRDYRQEGNQQEEDSTMIGSCSFYDHSLKTWFA